MKYRIEFLDHRLKYLVWQDNHAHKIKKIAVLSTRQAAHALHRTPRQIYRYIEKSFLHPAGPFLGDWLFDKKEIKELRRLLKIHRGRMTPPQRWRSFFPEYSIHKLSWIQDQSLILSRILEKGGYLDLKLLFKTYPRNVFVNFIRNEGARHLSNRNLNFWCWFFNLPHAQLPSRLLLGQMLGGVQSYAP